MSEGWRLGLAGLGCVLVVVGLPLTASHSLFVFWLAIVAILLGLALAALAITPDP